MMSNFENFRNSFKFKLILLIILISLVPFSLLGYFNLNLVRKNLERSIYSQMQITAQRLAFDQETIIGGQIEKINYLSRIFGEKILESSRPERESFLYSLLKEASYLEEIYLINKEGLEMARASRRLVVGKNLRDLKDDPAFNQLLQENIQWSQTFLDPNGQVRLKKIIPIYDGLKGELRGGMIIEISLRRVVEQLAQRQLGQEGRIFVIDGQGLLIGHQDFSQVLKQTDVTESLSVQQFITAASHEVSSANRYVSYDGQEVLGVYAPVKGLDWAVVQEIPVKIALASFYSLRQKLLITGGLLIFLAIIISIFFGTRFSSSLRSLQRSVQEIKKGNLDGEVKVQGQDEFSQLADTLNEMRLELRTRRRQEEIIRQKERLTSLGLLASGVAHELNNPLGVISAYSEDLLELLEEKQEKHEKQVTPEEIKEYLQIIHKQTKRGKEIISNLLNFARGSQENPQEINLKQIIDDTLKLIKYRLKKEQITVEISLEEEGPTVIAGTGEVQQVLLNVITNALDALTIGGNLHITVFKEGDFTCLKITDSGQGISPEGLKKIYDPFYTTKEPGKGTGLGLSICYGIMEKLGGHIEIISSSGEGTEVTLFFPAVVKNSSTLLDKAKNSRNN